MEREMKRMRELAKHACPDDYEDYAISIPTTPELQDAANVLGDYLASLSLPSGVNNKLVELMVNVTSEAKKCGFYRGVEVTVAVLKCADKPE